jgi:cation-transporting ATPase 13A1
MRKILFSSERVNDNNTETYLFIGLLVVCALVASSWVLYDGLFDASRNQFKLVLHCIMIVTSVVPPELPMELSLAVTHSLAALSKAFVYCTEPFRIPYAGRLGVLCFDKTGTLTQDKMLFRGVIGSRLVPNELLDGGGGIDPTLEGAESAGLIDEVPSESSGPIVQVDGDVDSASGVAVAIMASCHALFRDPRTYRVIGNY